MEAPDKKRFTLKEHREEILQLVRQYIREAEEQIDTGHKELSKDAEEYLLSYNWSGDRKGLELAVKRACILSDGPILQLEDFDLKRRRTKSIGGFIEERLGGFMRKIKRLESFDLYNMVVPEVEKALISMVLKETKGNQIKAAKLLGINRNTLRSKIKRLGIKLSS